MLTQDHPAIEMCSCLTKNPLGGTFGTDEVRPWNQPRDETSKIITFPTPYSAPPGIAVGFNSLDIGCDVNVRAYTSATDIQKENFRINANTWDGTKLYYAGSTWLEIPAEDDHFQFGRFGVEDDHPWQKPQLLTTRLIVFPKPYSAPPQVVVWLNKLGMGNAVNERFKIFATHITATGFTLHIDTWGDPMPLLDSCRATWVACTAGKAKVFTGTFNTQDMRPANKPQLYNSGYINFGNTFDAPPRVYMALNSLDVDCKKNLRVIVKASHVSAHGMLWHIDSYSDTILYSAGASFIALG